VTFSDKPIVDLVNENFVAVWESVAPVKVAVFDLGDGREIRGTVGGEIAISFCRPDGKVFEILPALQSPAATRQAIEAALAFYEETGATDQAILDHHLREFAEYRSSGRGAPGDEMLFFQRELDSRRQTSDAATADMSTMIFSKTGFVADAEPVVVVEPGGFDYYRRQVHEMLAVQPPRTSHEWRERLFVDILRQKLEGGIVEYDSSSLAPLSIIEE
jgi:hypothetical protein